MEIKAALAQAHKAEEAHYAKDWQGCLKQLEIKAALAYAHEQLHMKNL